MNTPKPPVDTVTKLRELITMFQNFQLTKFKDRQTCVVVVEEKLTPNEIAEAVLKKSRDLDLFKDPDFIIYWQALLDEYDLPRKYMDLVISESKKMCGIKSQKSEKIKWIKF